MLGSVERFCDTFGLYVAVAITTSGREYSLTSVARPDMSALLKQISQWLCPHRFSWPHSGKEGQDYQVCLNCGAVYGYDVDKMRRTKRLTLYTGAMSRQ